MAFGIDIVRELKGKYVISMIIGGWLEKELVFCKGIRITSSWTPTPFTNPMGSALIYTSSPWRWLDACAPGLPLQRFPFFLLSGGLESRVPSGLGPAPSPVVPRLLPVVLRLLKQFRFGTEKLPERR